MENFPNVLKFPQAIYFQSFICSEYSLLCFLFLIIGILWLSFFVNFFLHSMFTCFSTYFNLLLILNFSKLSKKNKKFYIWEGGAIFFQLWPQDIHLNVCRALKMLFDPLYTYYISWKFKSWVFSVSGRDAHYIVTPLLGSSVIL